MSLQRKGQLSRSQGLARKRVKPRRTTTPRCSRQRCGKPVKDLDLCKTHLRREADRLMSLFRRSEFMACAASDYHTDNGPCRGPLQWCHVHSRRYMAIRWEPKNAVVLCAAHHAYYTHKPLEWEQWCRDEGIPWDLLRQMALEQSPMDPAFVIRKLREAE